MTSSTADQCRALTGDGERCSHSAQNDGFCHQHDENDPTVNDQPSDTSTTDDESTERSGGNETGRSVDADPERVNSDVMGARESVQKVAQKLLGYPIDSIVGAAQEDDGWRVTVVVVERTAVPDTQDILGQFEVDLDSDHTVVGYRRMERYRRGDMHRKEFID